MDEARTFIELASAAGPAVLMFFLLAGFLALVYRLGIPITKGLVESLEALQDGWTKLTDSQAEHHEKMYEGMQKIMDAQEKRIQELERKVMDRDQEIVGLRSELSQLRKENVMKLAKKDDRIEEVLRELKVAVEARSKADREIVTLRAALSGLEKGEEKKL